MPRASRIAHRGLPFASPMSEADVDRALGASRRRPGALVVDIGCGDGAAPRSRATRLARAPGSSSVA
jgi:hypothetical protein